jgi:hypothetical protein
MGKKRLFILFTVFALALLVVVPGIAGISGSGASGVQIQNLSTTSPVNVVVELWNQDGSAAIPVSATGGDTINASAAKNYYLPTLPGVPDGAYAMAVSAGGPIAAIARTDWSSTGGAALYSSVAPGTDVIIPLVTGNFAGQTSQFSIQNTNTAAEVTDVEITLYGRGLAAPVATLSGETIAAGTSKTYSLADAAWGPLPNTGVDLGVPTGFVGSVQITSATDLVVQSFIDIAGTRGVTGFTGVPTASAADTLYCPLIRANYFGDTGISIVNPNAAAVDVAITFYADAGSPNTGTFTQDINVPANSSVIAFQGPGGNSRAAGLPGGTQSSVNPVLTNDGFYGVAKLVATGGSVQAVVNDTKFGAGWSVEAQSSYNCATTADAGTSFALPLVRRFHLSTTRLTTGIQIQNLTGAPVTVSLDLFNWDGTSQSASNPPDVIVPANGSGNFWNGSLTGLPTVPASLGGSGWFGSAILTADGDIVAVVSDEGYGSTAVDSANYNTLLMP